MSYVRARPMFGTVVYVMILKLPVPFAKYFPLHDVFSKVLFAFFMFTWRWSPSNQLSRAGYGFRLSPISHTPSHARPETGSALARISGRTKNVLITGFYKCQRVANMLALSSQH